MVFSIENQIDEQGIIQKYNESAVETFGYSKEEAIGQNITLLMPPEVAEHHDGYLRRYIETGVKHIVGMKRGAVDSIVTAQSTIGFDEGLGSILCQWCDLQTRVHSHYADVTAVTKGGKSLICELKV
jgi:PAS domain-containing protein